MGHGSLESLVEVPRNCVQFVTSTEADLPIYLFPTYSSKRYLHDLHLKLIYFHNISAMKKNKIFFTENTDDSVNLFYYFRVKMNILP